MVLKNCGYCGKEVDLLKDTYEEFYESSWINGKTTTTGDTILCLKCYIKVRKKLYKLLKTTS